MAIKFHNLTFFDPHFVIFRRRLKTRSEIIHTLPVNIKQRRNEENKKNRWRSCDPCVYDLRCKHSSCEQENRGFEAFHSGDKLKSL